MKVLTFSRQFPKGHPKAGKKTYFVEAICNAFRNEEYALPLDFLKCSSHDLFPVKEDYFEAMSYQSTRKFHTIRAGNRFKSGDMASLRVWSDKAYRSKQIEFAQVEVKKTWSFELRPVKESDGVFIKGYLDGMLVHSRGASAIAQNDGLTIEDFESWFCPAGTRFILSMPLFSGQIICWSDKIDYSGKPAELEKEEAV